MRNRALFLAFIVSAVLSLVVGLLSNLAASYLSPTFQERPWIIYVALGITFAISLPITLYLFSRGLGDQPGEQPAVTNITPVPVFSSAPGTEHLPTKAYRQLIGRDRLVGEIMAALRDPGGKWLIGIDGMGGIGKTALAREVLERCIDQQLFDVVVWEQVPRSTDTKKKTGRKAGGFTYETVLEAIARQLGIVDLQRLKRNEKEDRIRTLLQAQRVLVVLDNLETAKEPQNEIARKLRTLLDPSKALLTSRHRFEGDVYSVSLIGLDEEDSLRFIRQEAEEKGVDRVSVAESVELMQIAQATGGSPLAMKLVVGQLSRLSLDNVLEQIQNVQLPERQAEEDDYVRFYKYIFAPSWRLLSRDSQQLLIAMSHFASGVGGTQAALAASSQLSGKELQQSIDELWQLSFLEVGDSPSLREPRYYLHALTQYFVLSDIVQLL